LIIANGPHSQTWSTDCTGTSCRSRPYAEMFDTHHVESAMAEEPGDGVGEVAVRHLRHPELRRP
jgi:hypothetical protein